MIFSAFRLSLFLVPGLQLHEFLLSQWHWRLGLKHPLTWLWCVQMLDPCNCFVPNVASHRHKVYCGEGGGNERKRNFCLFKRGTNDMRSRERRGGDYIALPVQHACVYINTGKRNCNKASSFPPYARHTYTPLYLYFLLCLACQKIQRNSFARANEAFPRKTEGKLPSLLCSFTLKTLL